MSRLKTMLRAQARKEVTEKRAAAVQEQLNISGDGLELAARVAAAQPGQMSELNGAPGSFWAGYVTACRQLAAVLRCMRKGEPPEPGALQLIERAAREEAGEAPGVDA